MIKEIPKSDVVVRPFKVYKEWTLDENDVTAIIGEKFTTSSFDEDTDPKSNGFYKRLVFRSIESQFYRDSSNSSPLTEVGNRKNYTSTDERRLLDDVSLIDASYNDLTDDDGNVLMVDNPFSTIWVLPIPQKYFGEGIKIGSLVLLDKINNITYTDDGNSNLISSLDSRINGNVFYDRGLIVMHDVDEVAAELTVFTVTYRSTMTIYENEIFLSVNENEFNVSQNPTAVYEVGATNEDILISKPYSELIDQEYVTQSVYKPGAKYPRDRNNPIISSFDGVTEGSFDDYEVSGSVDQTGSYLAPFITTIGLYDNDNNMVVVAKLPKPIKSLPDYPVNFIVRFDT
jgi:hypothetical protein